MELKQLFYFVKASEYKSFSKAANALYITQQALSKSIISLEGELMVKLFERSSSGVTLTPEGDYLYKKCKPLIESYYAINNDVHSHFNIHRGTIKVCAAPGVFRSISPDVLLNFNDSYPDIIINRSEMPDMICEESVINGKCQLGCSLSPYHKKELEYIPVKYEPLFLIVHRDNPLSQKSIVDFPDLKQEKFICFNKDFRLNHLVINQCRRCGYEPNIIFVSADVDLLTKLVYLNKGIFICVKHVVEEIKNPDIFFVPFKNKNFKWRIGFIYRKGKTPDVITKLFIKYVLEHFQDV